MQSPLEPSGYLRITEETDESFQPTGVEFTPEDQSAPANPYDPELIRVDPKMFSLRQVLDMIDDQDLELAPDFQRLKVWTPVQRSRLIESVLLRIPLPAFYFSSDKQGGLQVVDGLQRLSTIHDFVRGGISKTSFFKLDGLEYLQDELGGKTFAQITSPVWVRRINGTQILANVIDPQTPYRVKFDIFRRINTGGSPLTSQEIRHCLSGQLSRDLLKAMVALPSFDVATGGVFRRNVRMVDREVALRFAAFRRFPGQSKYSEYATMDEFLNTANRLIEKTTAEQRHILLDEFNRAMANNTLVFGQHAFRKWGGEIGRVCPFNRALFDTWSVALADYAGDQLRPFATRIAGIAQQVMSTDPEYVASISAGTGDAYKVAVRFEAVRRILREAQQ